MQHVVTWRLVLHHSHDSLPCSDASEVILLPRQIMGLAM